MDSAIRNPTMIGSRVFSFFENTYEARSTIANANANDRPRAWDVMGDLPLLHYYQTVCHHFRLVAGARGRYLSCPPTL